MDRQTDQQTDQQTVIPSHRDAWTHLKASLKMDEIFSAIFEEDSSVYTSATTDTFLAVLVTKQRCVNPKYLFVAMR